MENIFYPQAEASIFLEKYSKRLYKLVFTYGWGANILAYEGDKHWTLIDSGYKNTKNQLSEQLLKIAEKPIGFIINSHYHGDHTGGNSLLSVGGKLLINANLKKSPYELLHCQLIEDKTPVVLDEETLELIPLSYGHSFTDMIIIFKNSNIIFTGDLYLSESFPLVSMGSKNSAYTLLDNLKVLYAYANDKTLIVSGHGKDTGKKQLKTYIEMVEATIAVVEEKIEEGYTKREIQKMDVLKPWNKWSGNIDFITKTSWVANIWRGRG